ncbi:polysaccharide deacetylase family protein [Mycoplasmatota bacterium zrk1]
MKLFVGVSLILLATANSYGWGYKKNGNEPPSIGKYEEIISPYDVIYIGDTSTKDVYLTFDTGYETGNTSTLLDVLTEENVPATFFVTGHFMRKHPELIKRMYDEGHIVGNHTWSHPDLTSITSKEVELELSKIENKYFEITNSKMLKFVRPPRGTFSPKSLKTLTDLGYVTVLWSLAHVDWHQNSNRGWEYAYNSVMDNIHNGAVILMHSVSEDNTLALERIIEDLKTKEFKFKPLTNLITDLE